MIPYNLDKLETITDFSIIPFLCIILIYTFTAAEKENLVKTSELFSEKIKFDWSPTKTIDFNNFSSSKAYTNYRSFSEYFTAIEDLRTRLTSYLSMPNQNFRRIIDALVNASGNIGSRVQRLRRYFQNERESLQHNARELADIENNDKDVERAEKLWKEIESLIAAICSRYEELPFYQWVHPWWFYLICSVGIITVSISTIQVARAVRSMVIPINSLAETGKHVEQNINNTATFFNALNARFWETIRFWRRALIYPLNLFWYFFYKEKKK